MKILWPIALSVSTLASITGLILTSCNPEKQPEKQSTLKPADSSLAEDAIRRAVQLRRSAPDSSITEYRRALELSTRFHYNDGIVKAYLGLARAASEKGQFENCLSYHNAAAPYARHFTYYSSLYALYLNSFGAHYYFLQSDFVNATNCYFNAINQLRKQKSFDSTLMVKLLFNLHLGLTEMGQGKQALPYLDEAEKIARATNDTTGIISILNGRGRIELYNKNYPAAEHYLVEALSLSKTTSDERSILNLYTTLASLYIVMDRTKDAFQLLEAAGPVAERARLPYNKIVIALTAGQAYNHLKQFRKTITVLTPAMDSAGKLGFSPMMKNGFRMLANAYKGLNDYKQALKYEQMLFTVHDSTVNDEKVKSLAALELKYKTSEKDKQLIKSKLAIANQQKKIAANKFIAFVSSLATAFLVMLLLLYRRSAKHKYNLQQQKLMTWKQEQEIKNLRSSMAGEEKERKRLSRELHDGIGSLVSSAIIRFRLLRKEQPPLGSLQNLEEIDNLLLEIDSELKKTANNLMPEMLLNQSFLEAVKQYCLSVGASTGTTIDVQSFGEVNLIAEDLKLMLYRCVQELIHNVIKHTKSDKIILQLSNDGKVLTLTVEDYGEGFDPGIASNGFGLRNVRSRIETFGGTMEIESEKLKGTTVYIEFILDDLNRDYVSNQEKN